MPREIELLARTAIGGGLSRFVDAHMDQVQGWVRDPNHETSDLSPPTWVRLTS